MVEAVTVRWHGFELKRGVLKRLAKCGAKLSPVASRRRRLSAGSWSCGRGLASRKIARDGLSSFSDGFQRGWLPLNGALADLAAFARHACWPVHGTFVPSEVTLARPLTRRGPVFAVVTRYWEPSVPFTVPKPPVGVIVSGTAPRACEQHSYVVHQGRLTQDHAGVAQVM